ncbi:MAG TPA: hypothetical protein VJ761_23320 [Ktedonobacteraceae bacterium]|nr:hypothetical protein [Ktedonobacteraceae bacterium]
MNSPKRKAMALPKEFFGIEEVVNPLEDGEVVDGGVVESSSIEEVMAPSEGDDVIDGGLVSMRHRITTVVLVIWVAWTFVGLIAFLTTGNAVLLLSSPAIMSIPLYKVLGYYY